VEIVYKPFESEDLNAVLYQLWRTAKKTSLVAEAPRRRFGDAREARGFEAVWRRKLQATLPSRSQPRRAPAGRVRRRQRVKCPLLNAT